MTEYNDTMKKILKYNDVFVENEIYSKYTTTKFPEKKLAILSCMDTRMTELLPAALGLKNGDAKVIKNAGGLVSHPFGSVFFSLLVAIYELEVDTILVVGHEDCGVSNLDGEAICRRMMKKGISQETLDNVKKQFKDPKDWLTGFGDVHISVKNTVDAIKNHPLIHKGIAIYGFVMNPETGNLIPSE